MAKKKSKNKKEIYWEGVGRRKTAVARVRIYEKKGGDFLVNEKKGQEYFQIPELFQTAISPLQKLDLLEKIKVSVKVKGGGVSSQAEAVRHGLARALVKYKEDLKSQLRKWGYLTRDPRMRERKKFGLKRARRAPQWSKR